MRVMRVMASMRAGLGLAMAMAMAAAAAVALAACGGGDGDGAPACDPMMEPCVLERAVSTLDVGAGIEDEDTCQSWTLNNPTELWVTSISQQNDGAYHHANWFFVPDDEFPLPDGAWSCSANQFDELVAALLGGYLFALSTQSRTETQALPPGSAIRIPPYSRVIGSSHLLNATDAAIATTLRLSLHTIPPTEVAAKMAPARIQYHDLTIDPMGRSAFTTECLLDDAHQQRVGAPLQYELHYALAHYHNLGVYTQLEIVGGARDGEVIMRHDGFGENFGKAFDPPLELASIGARGLRFTCGYMNPRAAEVRWGIGDQEMCVIALQARSNLAWDADVARGTNARDPGAPGDEVRYQGPCQLTAFPWDYEKPGGPPR